MTQINPPFDGSAPCPMCSDEVRGISALMHNFLVRWPENRAFVKLNDIRQYWDRPATIEVPHPLISKLFDLADELKATCVGMTIEGTSLRWTSETFDKVAAIVPRAEENEAALDALSEAHWADHRHSHGRENIIRESRGMSAIRFLPSKEWNHTVEVVPEGGDLKHSVCGTRLALHQHFKDNIARDPAFYGSVFCPKCAQNLPFAQFERIGPDRFAGLIVTGCDNSTFS